MAEEAKKAEGGAGKLNLSSEDLVKIIKGQRDENVAMRDELAKLKSKLAALAILDKVVDTSFYMGNPAYEPKFRKKCEMKIMNIIDELVPDDVYLTEANKEELTKDFEAEYYADEDK